MNGDYSIVDNNSEYQLNIDIDIQENSWIEEIDNLKNLILNAAKATFKYTNIKKHARIIEFSIILTNNETIQKLNSQYRYKNTPTNCLSFPAQEINLNEIGKIKFHDGFIILGDVIFSHNVIVNESLTQQKRFENHFIHLLIHSLLHLFGFDHEDEQEAIEMERMEVEILSTLNISSPYN